MKQYEHLPIFGIGPVYVISILVPTLIAVILRNIPVFASGKLPNFHIPFVIIGIIFVILSIFIWIHAVIISKLDENIKNNSLVTSGIYAWVRNPIYSAFLIFCTGVLFIVGNTWFFILPFFYWWLLTVLIKFTEEKWLQNMYGDEYIEYCKRVNRCWPWISKKSD